MPIIRQISLLFCFSPCLPPSYLSPQASMNQILYNSSFQPVFPRLQIRHILFSPSALTASCSLHRFPLNPYALPRLLFCMRTALFLQPALLYSLSPAASVSRSPSASSSRSIQTKYHIICCPKTHR